MLRGQGPRVRVLLLLRLARFGMLPFSAIYDLSMLSHNTYRALCMRY